MKIVSRGLLGCRLTQSYSRLECNHYKPQVIWTADTHSWPGDWEGRTVLALVSLAKATGKEPSYLEEILDILPELKHIGMGVYTSDDGRRFSSVGETVLKAVSTAEKEELRTLFFGKL